MYYKIDSSAPQNHGIMRLGGEEKVMAEMKDGRGEEEPRDIATGHPKEKKSKARKTDCHGDRKPEREFPEKTIEVKAKKRTGQIANCNDPVPGRCALGEDAAAAVTGVCRQEGR